MIRQMNTMLRTALVGLSVTAVLSGIPAQAEALKSMSGASIVSAGETSLPLQVGKGTLVRLNRAASEVFIVNPEVADIQVKSPRVIYIYGKAQGETSFYAIDDKDKTIYSANVSVTRNLDALLRAYEDMLPGTAISVSTYGNVIVLHGRVNSPDQAAKAEVLATDVLGTDRILNELQITQPTQVNLRVRIAEVSRSVVKELGFNWEGGYFGSSFGIGMITGRNVADIVEDPITQGPLKLFQFPEQGVKSIYGDFVSNALDLNYAIDALDQQGFLTVLAEPNLTALTGQAANFLAGGEFPIPVPSRDGIAIEYREFGVKLDFTPTVLNSGRISMRVRPEVSDLSSAGAIRVEGISIPSISTRRAETTVELGSGQSFAIAGLLQNDVVQDANKIPGLGDIPILGALFRSESFRRDETELLIVVTPYVVRPVSDRQLVLPTDRYVAPNDMDRFLNGKSWVPQPANEAANKDKQSGASLKKRAGFQLD